MIDMGISTALLEHATATYVSIASRNCRPVKFSKMPNIGIEHTARNILIKVSSRNRAAKNVSFPTFSSTNFR